MKIIMFIFADGFIITIYRLLFPEKNLIFINYC